jgi:long-chain acyl-CoA synthetase
VCQPNSIATALLDNVAAGRSAFPAFCRSVDNQLQWFNWRQIATWVSRQVAWLEQEQLAQGTHVASAMQNSIEWFVLDFACQAMGLVHVAIDPRWPQSSIAQLVDQSQSRLLYLNPGQLELCGDQAPPGKREKVTAVCHAPTTQLPAIKFASVRQFDIDWAAPPVSDAALGQLIERAAAVSADQPAQMLFTSGTTGSVKGVLLSHRNLVSNSLAKLDAAPQQEEDLRLNILPFCHAYARTCELSSWVLTRSQLSIASDWQQFLQLALTLRPTLMNLVPHLVMKLVQTEPHNSRHEDSRESASGFATFDEIRRRTGGRLRLLQVGGASLPEKVWHHLAECGLPPLQGYGLTEASPVVCSNRTGQQRPGTLGLPVRGVDLRTDEMGQLWVRGDNVMLGYHNDLESTRHRLQSGWLATGDLVEIDQVGHYRIVGRLSEQIVLSTAYKVSPEVIEARLTRLPQIQHAIIFGHGQPCLSVLIWPRPGILQSVGMGELQSCMNMALQDLPGYMHPVKIYLATEPIEATPELLTMKGQPRRQQSLERYCKLFT